MGFKLKSLSVNVRFAYIYINYVQIYERYTFIVLAAKI